MFSGGNYEIIIIMINMQSRAGLSLHLEAACCAHQKSRCMHTATGHSPAPVILGPVQTWYPCTKMVTVHTRQCPELKMFIHN